MTTTLVWPDSINKKAKTFLVIVNVHSTFWLKKLILLSALYIISNAILTKEKSYKNSIIFLFDKWENLALLTLGNFFSNVQVENNKTKFINIQ